MDTTDFFRKAVRHFLSEKGMTQKKLAKLIKQSPPQLNDFLHGRRNYQKDEIRERIAAVFNTTYTDMLNIGRELSQIKTGVQGRQIIKQKIKEENIITLPHSPHHPHHRLINKFKNKETAFEANQILLEIEDLDPGLFQRIVGYLEAKLEETKKKQQKNHETPFTNNH